MKKVLFLIAFCIINLFYASSQDVIKRTNGNIMRCTILSIDSTKIDFIIEKSGVYTFLKKDSIDSYILDGIYYSVNGEIKSLLDGNEKQADRDIINEYNTAPVSVDPSDYSFYELGGGLCLFQDNEVRDIYNIGYNALLSIRWDSKSRKFSAGPVFHASLFSDPEGINYAILQMGLRFYFSLMQSPDSKIILYNYIEPGISWGRLYVAYNGETFNVYAASAPFFGYGYRLKAGCFFLDSSYQLFNPKLEKNREITDNIENEFIFPSSNFKINIGLTVPFSTLAYLPGHSSYMTF